MAIRNGFRTRAHVLLRPQSSSNPGLSPHRTTSDVSPRVCEVFILNAYNNITSIINRFMTYTYLPCVDLTAAEHIRETKNTVTNCNKLNVQQ